MDTVHEHKTPRVKQVDSGKRNKNETTSSDSETDEKASDAVKRQRRIASLKEKHMKDRTEKEIKRAEEMKKWLDEQDAKRRIDFEKVMGERKAALQERHEQLQAKRREREDFRKKTIDEGGRPSPGNYVYKRMERDFHERVELPELRRQKDALERRHREIRSVDISRLQREGELAVLEQQARQERMRERGSVSAREAEGGGGEAGPRSSPRLFKGRYREAIEREKEAKRREEEEKEFQRLELVRRRQQYGRLVREMIVPSSDERLQSELEQRVRKLDEMKRKALERLEEGKENGGARVDVSEIFRDRRQDDDRRSSRVSQSQFSDMSSAAGGFRPYYRSNVYGGNGASHLHRRTGTDFWAP